MDNLLYKFYAFCCIYINNLVISLYTLNEYVKHLMAVLLVLEAKNISFNLIKAYIGFLSVKLLSRHVSFLGLSIPAERAATIVDLLFPKKLRDLKYWLEVIGWFRNHIPKYISIIEFLQKLKTALLKPTLIKGQSYQSFSRKTIIN